YRDRKAALARVRIDCRRRIPNCRVISRTCNFGQTVNTCRIFVCRDLTVRANISLRPRLAGKDRCPERSRDAAKAEAKLATEHPILPVRGSSVSLCGRTFVQSSPLFER